MRYDAGVGGSNLGRFVVEREVIMGLATERSRPYFLPIFSERPCQSSQGASNPAAVAGGEAAASRRLAAPSLPRTRAT
jgi:hypothetical protein